MGNINWFNDDVMEMLRYGYETAGDEDESFEQYLEKWRPSREEKIDKMKGAVGMGKKYLDCILENICEVKRKYHIKDK